MAYETIIAENKGAVALITLNRPKALNALNAQLARELGQALHAADEDPAIGCIVLTGSEKAFAAGADIKEMADFGPEQIAPVVEALGDAFDRLEAMPKISIAAINGFALGGGLELALAADLRYLAEDGKVGQPEIRLGVIPGAGGTQRLTDLVGPGRARELVYSGRVVGATEASALGLTELVVPAADVFERAMTDARTFAEGPREALAAAKAAIRASLLTPGPAGLAAEREAFVQLFGTADQREGMRAFLEKREPRFGGS
jgi:enoyl-CoA hydratase